MMPPDGQNKPPLKLRVAPVHFPQAEGPSWLLSGALPSVSDTVLARQANTDLVRERPEGQRPFVPLAEEAPHGLPPVRVCVWLD